MFGQPRFLDQQSLYILLVTLEVQFLLFWKDEVMTTTSFPYIRAFFVLYFCIICKPRLKKKSISKNSKRTSKKIFISSLVMLEYMQEEEQSNLCNQFLMSFFFSYAFCLLKETRNEELIYKISLA